jgi:hypothetical protein
MLEVDLIQMEVFARLLPWRLYSGRGNEADVARYLHEKLTDAATSKAPLFFIFGPINCGKDEETDWMPRLWRDANQAFHSGMPVAPELKVAGSVCVNTETGAHLGYLFLEGRAN